MQKLLTITAIVALSLGVSLAQNAEKKKPKNAAAAAEKTEAVTCPICSKPVNPSCATEYEGKTYAFATGACRTKWTTKREESLYHQVGGKAAINAAVDLFYTKVLADESVNHFFEDVNMKRQHNKQKEFLSAALGGPEPWTGKDMRKAHKSIDLTEKDFGAIAGHLQATLEELKVEEELLGKIMAVVASTKDEVLNKPKKGAE